MSYQPPAGAPGGWTWVPPQHPRAVVILVLGILGVVACGLCGIPAWIMGNEAREDLRRNPGAYSGEGMVTAGWVLGIVGTLLLVVSVLVMVLVLGGLALVAP